MNQTAATPSSFAPKGSRRWLQVAVELAPGLLEASFRQAGVLGPTETLRWRSPVAATRYEEYRDTAVLKLLGIDALPHRSLTDFWPYGGPVWDALGVTSSGTKILLEAKAHIAEAASNGTAASAATRDRIDSTLAEVRKHYAPRAKVPWTGSLYQYANRLAFLYFFSRLNTIPTKLVFLDFLHATDVKGPTTEEEWKGATELIHALLGLPSDLTRHGVFHAYVDVRPLKALAEAARPLSPTELVT